MQSADNQEKLLDSMVLLEVANKMYPSVGHFFSKYAVSDLTSAAHDLIQYVHSNGQSGIDDNTREVLATLDGARTYIGAGGHLWKPLASAKEQTEQVYQKSGLWQRVVARLNSK